MPQPTEHKSVQARILKYAGDIGWYVVPRSEAEERRGFSETGAEALETPYSKYKHPNRIQVKHRQKRANYNILKFTFKPESKLATVSVTQSKLKIS